MIVGGVLRAGIADSVDFDEASLAKTAAAEPILIDAADGTNEGCTGLVNSVVNVVFWALAAVSIDEVVSERADASLLGG